MSGQNLDLNPLVTLLAGGGGVSFAIFWVVRTVVRRFSRDTVELATDRAEKTFVTTLSETNTKLAAQVETLSRERNEALVAKGQLEAAVTAHQQRITTLEREVIYLRSVLARYVKSLPSAK